MCIKIERVEVNSCGPIATFNENMAPLTVIYAKNEKGKTAIVENIIASLFKDQKDGMYPSLRKDFIGSSRVTVTGISKKPETFTPLDKKRKIDSLLGTEGSVLPKSLFNLLFVKGAETDIIHEQGGITKSALKNLVSKQHIYGTIQKNIPREVGYTQFSDGLLVPKKRQGGYKTYEESRSRLNDIEAISQEFYSTLSESELIVLQSNREQLKEALAEQQKAKRHYAYSLSQKVQEIKKLLRKFESADLDNLDSNVKEYFRNKDESPRKETELDKYQVIEENSKWVNIARERYERCMNKTVNIPQRMSILFGISSLAGAFISYFFLPLLTVILLSISLCVFITASLFTFVVKRVITPESARVEINQIKEEFERRFHKALSSLSDFIIVKTELERQSGKYEQIKESIEKAGLELNKLRGDIVNALSLFGISDAEEDNWPSIVKGLKEAKGENHDLSIEYKEKLKHLGVDESDYLEQGTSTEYSRQKEEEIEGEIERLNERIEEENAKSEDVRKKMIEHIGYDSAYLKGIEEVAEALERKKKEYKDTMIDNLSTIIAGHIVSGSIEEFRKQEDEQIENYVNDESISGLIEKFTQKYNRVYLKDEEIHIGTESEAFNLKDMSTGAQEQILLALRMGIARKLSGKDSLFLLLDDAFQYSDWERRQILVEQVVEAIGSGWQVIYFTMDDDIRDRFKRVAKRLIPNDFKLIEF